MSHGLAAMALSGFLSRLTKCAESQDLRLEPLDVRKATFATVLARAAQELFDAGSRLQKLTSVWGLVCVDLCHFRPCT
jgi:hypothetical protein